MVQTLNAQMGAWFPSDFCDRFNEEFGQAARSNDPAAVERYLSGYSGSTQLAHVLRLLGQSEQAAATAASAGVPDDQSTNARVAGVAMKASVVLLMRDSSFQQAVDAQLAALAGCSELLPGQQLLTGRQLAYVCGCRAALEGGMMLVKAATVSVAAVKFVQKMARMCCEAVLQLEPDNPQGHMEAARFWDTAASHTPWQAWEVPPQPPQRVVDAYLRAVSLGQQRGSDWWVARCAPAALLACGRDVSRASKAAAAAAVRQAQPALKRCKKVLPDQWIKSAECLLVQTPTTLARIEADLGVAEGQAGAGTGGSSASSAAAASTAVGSGSALTVEEVAKAMRVRSVLCASCGSKALSLRFCGRCRQVQYCR